MKKVTKPRLFGAFTQEVRDIIEGAIKNECAAAIVNPCSGCKFHKPDIEYCVFLPWNDKEYTTAAAKYEAWQGKPCDNAIKPVGADQCVSPTVLNLCSGSWDFGITVDRNHHPDHQPPRITADVQALPFRDDAADVIIFDPPYSKKYKKQYGTYYANRRQVFKEVLRVLKPGGLLIFCHYFIPQLRVLHLEEVYMIHNRPWEHVRALSFSRKQNTLCDIYQQ